MIPAVSDTARARGRADIESYGGTEHLPKLPLPGSDDPPHSSDRLRDAQ